MRLAYPANPNRATNVPVTIEYSGGEKRVTINQRIAPPINRAFVSLGTFQFSADQAAVVAIRNDGTNGHVIADAVHFVPAK